MTEVEITPAMVEAARRHCPAITTGAIWSILEAGLPSTDAYLHAAQKIIPQVAYSVLKDMLAAAQHCRQIEEGEEA